MMRRGPGFRLEFEQSCNGLRPAGSAFYSGSLG